MTKVDDFDIVKRTEDLLSTGLFAKGSSSRCLYLTNTDYVYYPAIRCWLDFSKLTKNYIGGCPFESVFDDVDKEIQIKLLFNLDLFT
jgi:hypothetical protein